MCHLSWSQFHVIEIIECYWLKSPHNLGGNHHPATKIKYLFVHICVLFEKVQRISKANPIHGCQHRYKSESKEQMKMWDISFPESDQENEF